MNAWFCLRAAGALIGSAAGALIGRWLAERAGITGPPILMLPPAAGGMVGYLLWERRHRG